MKSSFNKDMLDNFFIQAIDQFYEEKISKRHKSSSLNDYDTTDSYESVHINSKNYEKFEIGDCNMKISKFLKNDEDIDIKVRLCRLNIIRRFHILKNLNNCNSINNMNGNAVYPTLKKNIYKEHM